MPTDALLTYMRARQRTPVMPAEDREALATLQAEAQARGVCLTAAQSPGGLRPSELVEIYRRDGWRCVRCGGGDNLAVAPRGSMFQATWLRARGRAADGLLTVCLPCQAQSAPGAV